MCKIAFSLTFIYLLTMLPMYQQYRHHLEFRFKFFGGLSSKGYNTIFSAEGSTFGDALTKCTAFCSGDQRCIGLELCQIRDDVFRCRVCCGWKLIGNNHVEEQLGCKYLEVDQKHGENLAAITSLSTVYIHGTVPLEAPTAIERITSCTHSRYLAHTEGEKSPWLQIGLKKEANVRKVLLYNRQLLAGDFLHSVAVRVTGHGVDYQCGYFAGPAATGDVILFMCENGASGVNVIIQILAENESLNHISICEVEVYQ